VTIISILSTKGSPGVTTLACLLGAAWPGRGPVLLIEADPAGGDLAARFGLSARIGWTTFTASARRSDVEPTLSAHLQRLPGELPVLVAARGDERRSAESDEGTAIRSALAGPSEHEGGLAIVDLGRFGHGDVLSESWLEHSDVSLLVCRGDVSSAVQLKDRYLRLDEVCRGRLGVVVVGGGYSSRALADFTGAPPLAQLPHDPSAADVASGASGSGRRLERSPLWLAAGRLASSVRGGLEDGWIEVGEPAASDGVPGHVLRRGLPEGPPEEDSPTGVGGLAVVQAHDPAGRRDRSAGRWFPGRRPWGIAGVRRFSSSGRAPEPAPAERRGVGT
jgi:hypothetical protein